MTQLHLMTVMGTRPEIIRLSEIIRCCDRYFRQTLVHTGQNWDEALHQVFFGIWSSTAGCSAARGRRASGADPGEHPGPVLCTDAGARPDALLILGDTNSCLSAISARRLQIPIFHLEAGNRCFDGRVPEEVNRRIVDVTADFNLCYTEHARRNLLASGLPPERIFVVGSPMPEVLLKNLPRIRASRVMERLGLEDKGYFLLSAHREENLDEEDRFFALMAAVNALAETYGKPILYACHPRARQILALRDVRLHPLVRVHPPLGFHDYNQLQLHAYCVLSDSGTLPEESSFSVGRGCRFPPFAFGPVPSGRRHWSAARFFWRASRSIRFWPQ